MNAIERWSSRSKPRRFGIPSRKSVSAEACNSSIRAKACANWVLSRRIVRLGSLGASDDRRFGACVAADPRGRAALALATALLRVFASLAGLFFFVIGIPGL